MRIYTRTGDDGTTGVQGGSRMPKSSRRITAYGAVDEANALLGVAVSNCADGDLLDSLIRIQNDLFVVGADLSNPAEPDSGHRVSQEMVSDLEVQIDSFDGDLPELANFVLPGGTALAASLHHARTVVRRAESLVVSLYLEEDGNPLCLAYLNRLSDLLFVLGRLANRRSGRDDIIWKPERLGSS